MWWSRRRRAPASLPPAALTHLTELHDVFSPEDARQAGNRTGHEKYMVGDLLRPRPWLSLMGSAQELPALLWRTEGPGLLALLGEAGPWVYVPDVAALQRLGRAYDQLVRAAWPAGGPAGSQEESSLLARLHLPGPVSESGGDKATLLEHESAFWTLAHQTARNRQEAWAAHRVWP
ncbi:hypothetical protein DEDE109153_02935 [Deinococcus deserti]|uniref:Uncharacterized protein n=1 Tax=Deinococcus deserti (strain DSM 17065 / CIP 109153 / LMG 22923 / VCD115) TaxID=546414 RepID=C1CUM4_DEIDV|nr:hypothetical protein [Deinococcus deserti]ACO45891.1 hypothetical protein Deide_10100 [Deinococcus deserti VCD115]